MPTEATHPQLRKLNQTAENWSGMTNFFKLMLYLFCSLVTLAIFSSLFLILALSSAQGTDIYHFFLCSYYITIVHLILLLGLWETTLVDTPVHFQIISFH